MNSTFMEPARNKSDLQKLLLNQLRIMRSTILIDDQVPETTCEDLIELIDRYQKHLESQTDHDLAIAMCVHFLGFELYRKLGTTLNYEWAWHWILIDLKIEQHLRLNGLEVTGNNPYDDQPYLN